MSNLESKTLASVIPDKFLTKVWTDQDYAETLMNNPRAAVEQIGGYVPSDVELKVVRDTDRVTYVHIPAAPIEGEIKELDLLGVQGGTTLVCISAISSALGGAAVSVFTTQICHETTKA